MGFAIQQVVSQIPEEDYFPLDPLRSADKNRAQTISSWMKRYQTPMDVLDDIDRVLGR